MKSFGYIFCITFSFFGINCVKTETVQNQGKKLVVEMTQALGGLEKYQKLKDVEYNLTYRDTAKKVQDVSIERYIFKDEKSYAEYSEHTKNVFPQSKNIVKQAFDGKQAWTIVDGHLIEDPQALKMVTFGRKTAYFWFNMMYKLLDPTIIYTVKPNRKVKGIDYNMVEVTYEKNTNAPQDTFLLYINPKTKLVDQFLFTLNFNGRSAPSRMMWVEFQEIDGLKFPQKMHYQVSDWEGNIKKGVLESEKLFSNIKFNNGFDESIFEKPDLKKVK